jgi:hypothetical protein
MTVLEVGLMSISAWMSSSVGICVDANCSILGGVPMATASLSVSLSSRSSLISFVRSANFSISSLLRGRSTITQSRRSSNRSPASSKASGFTSLRSIFVHRAPGGISEPWASRSSGDLTTGSRRASSGSGGVEDSQDGFCSPGSIRERFVWSSCCSIL